MILRGPEGQPIRLTEERWDHILLDHPEMADLKWTIDATLESPDSVLTSRKDPERVREYYKEFPTVSVSRYIRVVVCFDSDSPFVLTAHAARRIPRRTE